MLVPTYKKEMSEGMGSRLTACPTHQQKKKKKNKSKEVIFDRLNLE
jgi:hypothetical protein